MKLSVKNLGPITKGGTIDLDKRFYVFVGKNGSGKTYLANLLYGVFGDFNRDFVNNHFRSHFNLNFHTTYPKFTEKEPFIKIKKEHNSLFNRFSINDFILETFNKQLPVNEKTESSIFIDYTKNFYTRELKTSVLFSLKNGAVLFSFFKENNDNTIYVTREDNPNVAIIDSSSVIVNVAKTQSISNIAFEECNDVFWSYNFPNWLCHITPRVIFLPADRASFLSLWKYIISTERTERELLYKKNSEGILLTADELKNFQASYTLPVKHLIKQLESFDVQSYQETSYYADLIKELEAIMGGKIIVKEGLEGIGRKRFVFEMQENGDEIELFLASSSVNQLSLLYIYLKYWAGRENNFLIIDEPEINLHPENQVKLLNILMKFADMNNNRVLITTHSTLMADAVNNHVRIGQLQTTENGKNWLNEHKSWLKENQLDINENITHEDFGVYYFDGAIKNYEVKDYGVFFKDFANAEDKIKDAADILKGEIYNELHPKKAQ